MLSDEDKAAYDKIEKKLDFISKANYVLLGILGLDIICHFIAGYYNAASISHATLIISNGMTPIFLIMISIFVYLKDKREKIGERVYGKINY